MSDLLPCTDILTEVAAERRRQMEVEGWTTAHDDAHDDGSLAQAAACYCHPSPPLYPIHKFPMWWPDSWSAKWWKPKSRRRNLIRAAALIIAEIERLDRAEGIKHEWEVR